MSDTHADRPNPLAALHVAFDELALRRSAFHAVANVATAGVVCGWAVVAVRGDGFDAADGGFTAPARGHYLFMASAGAGIQMRLLKDGDCVALALDDKTSLLVAALKLVRGDVVTLHVDADADGAICWRGART